VDDVGLDGQVLVDEFGGIGVVDRLGRGSQGGVWCWCGRASGRADESAPTGGGPGSETSVPRHLFAERVVKVILAPADSITLLVRRCLGCNFLQLAKMLHRHKYLHSRLLALLINSLEFSLDLFQYVDLKILFAAILALNARNVIDDEKPIVVLQGILNGKFL